MGFVMLAPTYNNVAGLLGSAAVSH